MRKIFCILLAGLLLFSGCTPINQGTDLMATVQAKDVEKVTDLTKEAAAVTDFGVRLFQQSLEDEKNILISPLSVMSGLTMMGNGASGETLSQLETVLGLPVTDLTKYLHSYVSQLPSAENYRLSLANSIWFTDSKLFTANPDFLQTNADYFGADMYQLPFSRNAVRAMNNWVDEKTDGMIPEIIKEIPDNALMYLINALAFEAKWENEYERSDVDKGTFTLEDGTTKKMDFMYSEEHKYLEDENAVGVIKYYKENKYAFAALLPNEGVTVAEYAATLTGDHLYEMLANPARESVKTAIPKFEADYSGRMEDVLKNMGLTDAFDPRLADFSQLGSFEGGNIYVEEMLHKTYISVDEKGTKATALFAGLFSGGSEGPIEYKYVYLDRPFIYMLIDCETNLPFFIGAFMDPK
ncbi:MAG: serpin family protein [Firmicutes bacterium]|nr:serpin family protein [Bacillota bacterium]